MAISLCNRYQKQRGASLIVALIMLLLLTIIGLTAMQGTSMQEKMAGNMRDNYTALHSAEIALDYSESWLQQQIDKPTFKTYGSCSSECYIFERTAAAKADLLSTDIAKNNTWIFNATLYGDKALKGQVEREAVDILGVSRQPEMLIEKLKFEPDSFESATTNKGTGDYKFRHTVQAKGASVNGETIIQTVYVKRFN